MERKEEFLELIEKTLDEVLPAATERPTVLFEAMRYAVGAGGKRVRPLLCLAAAEAVGGTAADARYAAAAIELLHNYTLIHDDLPSMDNDVERRGKPSVWAKYGEATAILAADAMQSLAFRVAAKVPRNGVDVIEALASAGIGVVQGQVEDVAKSDGLDFIYMHKTSDLFVAAAVMGGYAADAKDEEIAALRVYARNLGLAFQFEDDLLDGDSPYTKAEIEKRIHETTDAAIAALAALKGNTDFLTLLAASLVGRNN